MNTDSTDMVQAGFAQLLQQTAGLRLKPLGYEYDTRLQADDELFGFSKRLSNDDVYGVVQFQRHDHAANDDFTINLLRIKAEALQSRSYGGYTDSRGARLSYVVWFVHNLRFYPQPDYWWAATELAEALDQLENYGVPWLEDTQSKKPWEMPLHHGDGFAKAIQIVVAPELAALGFLSGMQSLAGRYPYPYFVKQLPHGEYAFIEFQSAYSLDPDQFQFDVRLQRKATDNPLDFNGHYHEWRTASLSQLVWRERYATDALLTVEAVQSLLWHYADRVELDDRLREVVAQLKRLGVPWLESRSP